MDTEIELPLKLRLFVWASAMLMSIIAVIGAALLILAVVGGLWAAWYVVLYVALLIVGVTANNMITAASVYVSAGLALFSAFFVRRFSEEPVFYLKITGEVEVPEEEKEND